MITINKRIAYYIMYSMGIFCSYTASSQEQPKAGEQKDIYELSLTELMDIPISSASKKEETLFDAPLSSYTITKADIDRAGVTSIMEALRLAPGIIVREETNGIYDIHIRGFDNVTRTQPTYQKGNYATLIMIDSRPIYNPVSGGTTWEALPIDVNNVERIEIVRGPSAALFGPNAVSGVINIITRRATGDKLNVVANAQFGTSNTKILNASVGKNIGKFSIYATANVQTRGKYDDQYYSVAQQKFVDPADIVSFTDDSSNPPQTYYLGTAYKQNYPHVGTSLNHQAANAFIGYKFKENVKLDITVGTVKTENQKIYSNGVPDTYFNTNITTANHTNLSFIANGFKFRSSINATTDNTNVNSTDFVIQKYDHILTDAVAEYDFTLSEKCKITPGVSYQGIDFDDTKYHNNITNIGLFNGKPSMRNYSGYLRSDLNFSESFRVMAALRVDKFSAPDKAYVNYELATTYKLNESNLVRFAITRSNSGSYMGNNYQNLTYMGNLIFGGNTHLKLFTIDMQEIGFRSKITNQSQLDIDVFRQQADNFTILSGLAYTNSPLVPTQYGTTISFNYVPDDKFQIKPFVTIQTTTTAHVEDGWNSKHTNTPSFYGGYYLNYRPLTKMNINVNGYYFAAHRQYDTYDPNNINPQGDIKGKFLVNVKASYTILKGLNVYVNARNALNALSREFYAADQTKGVYLIGMSFNMN